MLVTGVEITLRKDVLNTANNSMETNISVTVVLSAFVSATTPIVIKDKSEANHTNSQRFGEKQPAG